MAKIPLFWVRVFCFMKIFLVLFSLLSIFGCAVRSKTIPTYFDGIYAPGDYRRPDTVFRHP